jgi:hypothetical protein
MTDIGSTTPTPGTRGHTRTTWDHGLRGLFRRLREENPRASKAALQALFMTEYLRDDDLMEAAGIRVFGNDWSSWHGQQDEDAEPQSQPRSVPARQQQDVRQRQSAPVVPRPRRDPAVAAALVASIRTTILLDLLMPNGKRLRDCTGTECSQAGGWLVQVGTRIGSDGIVGERMSEAELRDLCDSSIAQA